MRLRVKPNRDDWLRVIGRMYFEALWHVDGNDVGSR